MKCLNLDLGLGLRTWLGSYMHLMDRISSKSLFGRQEAETKKIQAKFS